MKWQEMRSQYPNQFILIGDIVKENISPSKFRVLEGSIIEVSEDPKEIRKAYRHHKSLGKKVLYSLPSTQDFVVENIPIKGILKNEL